MLTQRESRNKAKRYTKKLKQVFALITHVVAAPRGFACMVIPTILLYIPSFIKISFGGFRDPGG